MESVLEFFAALIGLGLVGLFVVLPIIAWVRAQAARKLAVQSQENSQRLAKRVEALEAQISELQGRFKAQSIVLQQALHDLRKVSTPREVPAPAVAAGPEPAAPSMEAAGAEAPVIEPPRPTAALTFAWPTLVAPHPHGAATAKPNEPAVSTAPRAELPATKAPAAPIAPPQPQMSGAKKPASHEAAKRILNLEEVLGTDWLNKLGMISVVIGVALFLAYEMRELGPAGKVLVGFAVSGAFLGIGFFLERRERWRILARAALGGGWALLYFTTYAMNHITAARVLKSESWDFVFLTLVAAAMVAHTLRYNSRVITGLAFLLAFSTINISHAGATSLLASAILAVALVVIVITRRWFDLEVIAIVAIFINHYYWLRPIIEPMGAHRHHFAEFIPSAALLTFYWLVFRVSYILRRIPGSNAAPTVSELKGANDLQTAGERGAQLQSPEVEERISTVAALLNSFLFLGLLKYQSVHPEWAFRCLLALGAIEFTLGQLPANRRRRTPFVILSTIGSTLIAAALPLKYSGATLPVLWLAEAEALFLAGVFTREVLFRWLGIAAEFLVAGRMFFVDTQQISQLRETKATDFSDPRRAMVFALAALAIFANAHWVPRRWPDLLKAGFEKRFYRFQSYLGGFLLLAAVWAICTEPWLAVGFAASALLLAVVGSYWKFEELSVLANSFALLGFLRVVFANFAVVEVSYFNAQAVISISLAAALLYLASRWIGFSAKVRTVRIPEAYTWVATFVVALLAWYQLWPASVALGWALIGLVLFQLGFECRSASLRLQSYAVFMASFFRIFFVDFNAEGVAGQLSPRLYTALPLALLFYFVYGRLEGQSADFLSTDSRFKAADLHCYLGTITLAAAMRFELGLDWVAAAWASLVVLFVLIAWRYGRRIFLGQALLLAAGVFFRTVFHNFYQRSYFPSPSIWSGRWMTVGTSIALVFLALLVGLRLKLARPEGAAKEGGLIRRAVAGTNRNPAQVFFFVSFILLTGLLYLELRAYGMSTVAWGAEAVAVFLFALAVKERSFRLSALGLLLVCVGKIIFVDVWGLEPRDRYLTFIALGIALLSVSFLYTRYKEVLRGYL